MGPPSCKVIFVNELTGLTTSRPVGLARCKRKPPLKRPKAGRFEWGTLSCKFFLINKLMKWATHRTARGGVPLNNAFNLLRGTA